MLYAKDELNNLVRASKGTTAFCPGCNQPLIPKCGSVKVHHWSHIANDCDPWTEPITQWHLDWQEYADLDCREVVIRNGEIHHRADIRTRADVVVEIQHSTISQTVIAERERFYGDMCWVFDLTKPSSRYSFLYRGDLDTPERLPISNVLNGNELRQFAQRVKSTPLRWIIGERIHADNIRSSQYENGVATRYSLNFERGDPILGAFREHTGPISQVYKATKATGLIPFIGWRPVKYRTAIFEWKSPKKHVLACKKPVFLDLGSPHWLLYIDQTGIGPSLYKSNRFLSVLVPKADFVAGVIQATAKSSSAQAHSFIASAWAKDMVIGHYDPSGGAAGVMQLKQRQLRQQQSVLQEIREWENWAKAVLRQRAKKAAKAEAKKQNAKAETEQIKSRSRLRFPSEYWLEVERLWQEAAQVVAPGAKQDSSARHWQLRRLKPSKVMGEIRRYDEKAVALMKRVRALMVAVGKEAKRSEGLAAIHNLTFYATEKDPRQVMKAHRAAALKIAEEYERLDQDCHQFIQRQQAQAAEEERQRYEAAVMAREQAERKRSDVSFARFPTDYWNQVEQSYNDCRGLIATWDREDFRARYRVVIERALESTGIQGLTLPNEARAVEAEFSGVRKILSGVNRARLDSYVGMSDPLLAISDLLAKMKAVTVRYQALEEQFPKLRKERTRAEVATQDAECEAKQGTLF